VVATERARDAAVDGCDRGIRRARIAVALGGRELAVRDEQRSARAVVRAIAD
jgi:hypothetical protein